MQRFFEMKRRIAGIFADELQLEFRTKGDPVRETKFCRPPPPRLLIALDKHGYSNSGLILDDGIELPQSCAYESMCGSVRIVCLAAKPGKADRNSATNCLTRFPSCF